MLQVHVTDDADLATETRVPRAAGVWRPSVVRLLGRAIQMSEE